ncbi:MAG: hypothetical protein RLZZ15_808 [Verrucomicrobiota bacterium]|jgi:hypothetical protein
MPSSSRFRFAFLALAAAVVATLGTGCTHTALVRVKPWERAGLTDYTMNPARDPLATAMAEHVFFSRETATGGRGVGGSGCGCN